MDTSLLVSNIDSDIDILVRKSMEPILNYASLLLKELEVQKSDPSHPNGSMIDATSMDNSTTKFLSIESLKHLLYSKFNFQLIPHPLHLESFLVSSKDLQRTIPYILQNPKEPRVHFLSRSPLLLQESLNSGNLYRYKSILKDILTDNCTLHLRTSPPIGGCDKIYEMYCKLLRNSPDYYVLFSNVRRSKKRIISFTSHSYGTLPFVNNQENSVNVYNFYGSSIMILDELNQVQRLKFDTLKREKKVIKFERKDLFHFVLNREVNKVVKIISVTTSLQFL